MHNACFFGLDKFSGSYLINDEVTTIKLANKESKS